MVRRLIEDEQVVIFQRNLQQRDPAPLAAGQCPDRLEHVLAEEAEAREFVARLVDREVRAHRAHLLHERPAQVEAVDELLVEVAGRHLVADLGVAAERTQPPEQRLHERGLAGAVRADHPDALAAVDRPVEVGDDGLRALVPGRQLLGAQRLAPARMLPAFELDPEIADRLPHVLRAIYAFQLLEHLAPRLRLLRLLPSDVAPDEVFGLLDLLLLPHVVVERLLQSLLALRAVRVVAAGVTHEPLVLHVDDRLARRPEERAVMRHDQHGLRVVGDALLEFLELQQIEVVRRLIEEQHVRFAQQYARDLEPRPLPAGQRTGGSAQIFVGEADLVRERLRPRLQRVAADLFELVLQFPELGQRGF